MFSCGLRGPRAAASRHHWHGPDKTSRSVAVTEWVLLELMTGLRTTERKESLLQWFTPVVRLSFEVSWWEHAWDLAARLRREGITPTAANCLIATVAINHQAILIHCDANYESMKPVVPLVTLDWTSHLL